MNKFLKGISVLSIALLLTGCGGKKVLTCESSTNQDDFKETSRIVLTFDKKANITDMFAEVEISDFDEKLKEDLEKEMKSTCDNDLKDIEEYASCDVSSKNDNVTVKLLFSDKAKEESNKEYDDIESYQKDLEQTGFTCELK